jgi:hypothetical protein
MQGATFKNLMFPLRGAIKRHAKRDGRLLERIAGAAIQVDLPEGEAIESRSGDRRRATAAEAHRTRIWFSTDFELDCRKADFLSQVATRLRAHIAELSEIADRIEAAAKRRRAARPKPGKSVRVSA